MQKKYLIFCFVICYSISFQLKLAAQSSSWSIKNRFQCGVEFDNNIRESRYDAMNEPSFRMLLQSRGTKNIHKTSLHYDCSFGYQAYDPGIKEDKFINEYNMKIEQQLARWLFVGINTWSRVKFFLYNSIDYYIFTPQLYSNIKLPLQSILTFYYSPQKLYYWSSSYFDFYGNEAGVIFNKNLSRRLSLEISASFNGVCFKRRAIDKPLSESIVLVSDEVQQDDIQRFYIKLVYFKYIYISMGYFFELDKSNSYGSSYRNHWMVFSISKKLPQQVLLRTYAMIQKKKYQETLGEVIPLELDTEKEDNNFFILDFSRAISPGCSAFLRFAYFQNESPYRSYYYKKQTFNLGLDIRF